MFVIDSKHLSAKIQVANGTIWRRRHPMTREIETLKWEAAQVSAALGVPATAMFCFVGRVLPEPVLEIAGVYATTPQHVAAAIVDRPPSLTVEEVNRISPKIPLIFPPRTAARTPARSAPRRQWPSPMRASPRRPRRSTLGRETSLAGLLLAGVVLLVVWLRPDLLSKALNAMLPAHEAPALADEFSCPSPGTGWTLVPAWPGTPLPETWFHLEWASTKGGPWTRLPEWQEEAAAPTVAGVAPGAAVWLPRVGGQRR